MKLTFTRLTFLAVACLMAFNTSTAQTFTYTGPGAIPDNGCGAGNVLEATISVSGIGTIGAAGGNSLDDICLNITHTWAGDLDIELESPAATIVDLSSGNGGDNAGTDAYINTCFNALAATAITSGSAPFTGTFTPEGDLTTLNGESADGDWILRICDSAGGDTGDLTTWSIDFVPTPSCPAPTGLGVTSITTMSADFAFTGDVTESHTITLIEDPSGAATSTTIPLAAGTQTTNLSGLAPSTDYAVSVTSDCGSATAGPVNFTTADPPTSNDNCGSATAGAVGAVGTCTSVSGTNIGATDSGVSPSCASAGSYSGGDIWFSFVAPSSGNLTIQVVSSAFSSTHYAVYEGPCSAAPTEVACVTFANSNDLAGLTAGATYYIQAWDYGNDNFGTLELCLEALPGCLPPTSLGVSSITQTSADLNFVANDAGSHTITYGPTPFTSGVGTTVSVPAGSSSASISSLTQDTEYAFEVVADCGSTVSSTFTFTTLPTPAVNDDCNSAIALFDAIGAPTGGNGATYNTTGSTASNVSGDCSTGTPDDDIWFSIDAEPGSTVTINAQGGTGFDGVIGVFTGSCLGVSNVPGTSCTDNTGSGSLETITFTVPSPAAPAPGAPNPAPVTLLVQVYEYFSGAGGSGPVTVSATLAAPLPVELSSFSARAEGTKNVVEWSAASEEDFYMYTLERSTNANSFDAMAEIAPKGTSETEAVYAEMDYAPAKTTYYRLRMEDLDGSVEYSRVVAVERQATGGTITLAPNPAKDKVIVGLPDSSPTDRDVIFSDANGRIVMSLTIPAGEVRQSIDLGNLATGLYSVTVTDQTTTISKRLVIK